MEKEIEYQVGDKKHIGYLVSEDENEKPVVLVCHAFEGRNEVADNYARYFADLGYIGFAVDLFGEKKVESNLEGCMKQITPFFDDRQLVMTRLLPFLELIEGIDYMDSDKIGAIGFCFGGMCALDLARNSEKIKGVISVHGLLSAPKEAQLEKISAKVLALHGYKDPQVPHSQIHEFMEEMDKKNADWQLHYYGNAKHAFTDPKAFQIGDKKMGREYNEKATLRMKKISEVFFDEVLQ